MKKETENVENLKSRRIRRKRIQNWTRRNKNNKMVTEMESRITQSLQC